MTSTLLFCIAEEAKSVSQLSIDQGHCWAFNRVDASQYSQNSTEFHNQFIPRAMREVSPEKDTPRVYYLVESKVCPDSSKGFKCQLQDGEPFESEFIGASQEECQNWAKRNWDDVNFIQENIIAIADERSARDGTLLLSYYCSTAEHAQLEFEGWGFLPPRSDTWYDFRIEPRGSDDLHTDLFFAPIETAYPTYFGRPEKFTNDAGVFDVSKASLYVSGIDSEQEDEL
jgi:hypothetical protein